MFTAFCIYFEVPGFYYINEKTKVLFYLPNSEIAFTKNKICNVRQGFDNEDMKAYKNGTGLPTNDWSASQPSCSWQILVPDGGTEIA